MGSFDLLAKEKLPRTESFPVIASRYIILDSVPRKVSIGFTNTNCHEVTGLRFLLRQFDDKNNLIGEQKVEIFGLLSRSKSEFRIDRTIGFACVRVEVQIQSAIFGEYEYINEGDHVRVDYFNESDRKSKEFIKEPTYTVSLKSKKFARLTYLFVFVIFAIVIVTASLCGIFGKHTDTKETFEPKLRDERTAYVKE